MAAAFELTRPEHQGRYTVTVYQQGWRLGGKGASGRGPGDRIEEHGLHIWMGFYENAFRLLRECYGELGRDPETCRFARWDDVFYPDRTTGVVDRDPECVVIVDYGDVSWEEKRQYMRDNPGLSGIAAVQNDCFVALPYSAMTPGVRNAEAVETIARTLHPDAF